jgi:hypothetical protein
MIAHMLILSSAALLGSEGPPRVCDQLLINEIRTSQWTGSAVEYFELLGPPAAVLDGVWYLVLGDDEEGTGYSGVIEEAVDLSGHAIDGAGLFIASEAAGPIVPNMTVMLNFEDDDNVTHMLVHGFTGAKWQDLDLDDDGVLDIMPWESELCSVSLVKTPDPDGQQAAHVYGVSMVGPIDGRAPAHVYRCFQPADHWLIGSFMPMEGVSTPGMENHCAAGDVTFDGVTDMVDLMEVIRGWGVCPELPEYCFPDLNQDRLIDVEDVVLVILNWTR